MTQLERILQRMPTSAHDHVPVTSSILGVERIVGLASVWELDRLLGRYRRMPKTEQPRERPEWSDQRAGACEDLVWHPLVDAWVTPDGNRLIVINGETGPFWVPLNETGFTPTWNIDDELARSGYTDR